jgi:hypothetical protein
MPSTPHFSSSGTDRTKGSLNNLDLVILSKKLFLVTFDLKKMRSKDFHFNRRKSSFSTYPSWIVLRK